MSQTAVLSPANRPPEEFPILVLVDGSNVAFGGSGRPRLGNLTAVLRRLDALGHKAITLVDATLRHKIDEREGLERMIQSEQVYQAPSGRSADEFLEQAAMAVRDKGWRVYIITNDRSLEKRAEGAIPRIAHLVVRVGDVEEWMFSPRLDSLTNPGRRANA